MTIFSDVAVRQGLKMALAGTLGFAAALWLRLPNPTWCIFTVVVLMMAQYVGAIAEKAVLRAAGTIVGALLGVFLIGNFASEPGVVIVASFAIAAFGTMMFGGNWYPYAFFLAALTTLVVVGSTMEAPQRAWPVAAARIQEIILGILVSTVVTSVVWPRYARVEFAQKFRATLREAGQVVAGRGRRLLATDDPAPDLTTVELGFSTRMNALRLLLRYGQRESTYFRAKLPVRRRMTAALGALFEAAESLGQQLPADSIYRELIGGELRAAIDAVEAEIRTLAESDEITARENHDLSRAITALATKLRDLREAGATRAVPIDEAMDLASHYTALLDLVARLRVIRECLHDIHQTPETIAPPVMDRPGRLRISGFWFRNGLKSGLTATLALIYVNWVQPPGGLTIPFAAWLLTATSRMYPGGEGDRRAFSYAGIVALIGIPYAALLFVLTPYLAHYAWMNVFLAVGLFGLGYTIARQGGISLYGQCGMLFFVGAVGLNAQEPVTFAQIVDVYFGVVVALVLSAVIQRLLWPLLPQREICALFGELFAVCRELLEGPSPARRAELEERLALIPPELAAWIRRTTTPEYPAGETARLLELLRTAERLAYCLLASRRIDELDVPAEAHAGLRADILALEARCRETLDGLESTFRWAAPPPTTGVAAAFTPIEHTLAGVRQRYLAGELTFPHVLPYFGALNFLEAATRALDRCGEQLRGLQLDRYRGDYAL